MFCFWLQRNAILVASRFHTYYRCVSFRELRVHFVLSFQVVIERLLGANRFLGGIMLEYIAQIPVNETGFLIVAQLHFEHVDQFKTEVVIEYRNNGFDAAIQVATHPVGRSQEEARLAAVVKIPNARMLQEAIDNSGHAYVLAVGLSGNQAADTANDEVDLNATL